jgi:hypothetical protein
VSLWYDEVVSMRLAGQEGPAALIRLLFQIEATRAPLYFLMLQGWLRTFGTSDASGRLFSAVCGILTVVVVHRIGRRLYDARTALWGAWLCALSPLLIRYSQEVKMYAWLVLLTCLSWDLLLSLRTRATLIKIVAYTGSLVGLAYTHPLGIFMVVSQGVAYLSNRSAFALGWRQWVGIQGAFLLMLAPWLGYFLDHPPESVSGRLPYRFLIGLPIGFTGGDRRTLLACWGLIAWGMICVGRQGEDHPDEARPGPFRHAWFRWDSPGSSRLLMIWLTVPPLLLFGYSRIGHPIFGPARYTLFVAPAYLLLLARGIVKLPVPCRFAAAVAGAALSGWMLQTGVYSPDLKADWRDAAARIAGWDPPPAVIVLAAESGPNVEVETARYYLPLHIRAMTVSQALADPPGDEEGRKAVVIAVGVHHGVTVAPMPESLSGLYEQEPGGVLEFPGLRLVVTHRRPMKALEKASP